MRLSGSSIHHDSATDSRTCISEDEALSIRASISAPQCRIRGKVGLPFITAVQEILITAISEDGTVRNGRADPGAYLRTEVQATAPDQTHIKGNRYTHKTARSAVADFSGLIRAGAMPYRDGNPRIARFKPAPDAIVMLRLPLSAKWHNARPATALGLRLLDHCRGLPRVQPIQHPLDL